MSDTIFLITTILLIVLLISYYKIWGMKMLLHPGFYFAMIWVIAVPSQWYLMKLKIALIPFPKYIDELNIFVAFTAFCFLIFSFQGRNKNTIQDIELNFLYSKKFYKILLYVTLAGVSFKFIYSWLYLGATLNMGETRLAYTKDLIHIKRSFNTLEILFSYMSMFYPVITILAGYYLGRMIQKREALINSYWLLGLPLLITFIQVITIGGRNPMAIGIKYYLFGLAFTMSYYLNNRIKRKYILYALMVILSFGSFSSFVNNQRMVAFGATRNVQKVSDNVLINNFSAIMQYMSDHYWGYQLRRNDSFNSSQLGFGYFTFNGIFLTEIPFSSLIGFQGNLGDILEFEENRLDYKRLARLKKDGFYTTRSVYIEMICDFGQKGIFLFIILFTYYSNRLFINVSNRKFQKPLNLFFLFLCFNYWASSNFQSVYATGIFITFIIFWLFDLLQKMFYNSPIRTKGIIK